MPRLLLPILLVGVLATVVLASPAGRQDARRQTFRSTVTLVPLDVRVVDNKNGQMVTDLRREDFRIIEDRVPQEIRHFEIQALAVDPAAPARTLSMRGAVPAASRGDVAGTPGTVSPQRNRVFLIVLGRGRLQAPSKGLDAILDFVRTRLLPQDLVAVLAYGRACDFTSDHQRVGRIVERFKRENDAIEQETTSQIWGLAGVFGSRSLPKSVRARIDRIFQDEAAIPSRYIGSAENSAGARRLDKDVRDASPLPLDPGFDAFVATNVQVLQDIGSIYAAIAYLREFEGEKHVLVVTESGFLLPRVEDDQDLVNAASDARVAINIIQTGGMTIGASALMFKSMRAIAEDTGGIASLAEYSRAGLDHVDSATRGGYLLGYYPTNTKLDGRFRTVQVKVNRRNVRVLFRHGYYARDAFPLFSRRGFIVRNRLIGAAVYEKEINDIDVKLQASVVKTKDGAELVAQIRIDPSRLYFTVENGMHVGRIDIGEFGANEARKILCEGWQTADLNFSEETFQTVTKTGFAYRIRMPLKPGVRTVTVAVYDYMADLIGTTRVRLQ